jgi:hypothetical protein
MFNGIHGLFFSMPILNQVYRLVDGTILNEYSDTAQWPARGYTFARNIADNYTQPAWETWLSLIFLGDTNNFVLLGTNIGATNADGALVVMARSSSTSAACKYVTTDKWADFQNDDLDPPRQGAYTCFQVQCNYDCSTSW